MTTEKTPTEKTNVPAKQKPAAMPVPQARLKSLMAQDAIQAKFKEVLGSRAPAFMSSVISAVSANKYLSECEPMSIISSAAIAAAMDLPISPSLGFAHIVPYSGRAQFQIGWKGFVQLALRSGQYKSINITTVLEGQIQDHDPFTGEMKFSREAKSKTVVGYLLYFRLLNGYEKYFYMTREQCEEHGRRYSASFNNSNGMWKKDFESMALKTVAKQGLSKYGILSVDMQRAVEVDQGAVNEDGSVDYIDAPADDKKVDPKASSSRLSRLVSETSAAPEVPPSSSTQHTPVTEGAAGTTPEEEPL